MSGEELVKFRTKYQLSQQDLADMLGCRQQTVGEWEVNIMRMGNAYRKLFTQMAEKIEKAHKNSHGNDIVFRRLLSEAFGVFIGSPGAIRGVTRRKNVQKRKEEQSLKSKSN